MTICWFINQINNNKTRLNIEEKIYVEEFRFKSEICFYSRAVHDLHLGSLDNKQHIAAEDDEAKQGLAVDISKNTLFLVYKFFCF